MIVSGLFHKTWKPNEREREIEIDWWNHCYRGRNLTISHHETCSQHMRNLYCLKAIEDPSNPIPQRLRIRLITDPAMVTFLSKRRASLSWTSYQTDLKMSVIFQSHVFQQSCMEFSVVWEIKTSWGIIFTGPKKSNFLNHIIWLWYWLQRFVSLRSMSMRRGQF